MHKLRLAVAALVLLASGLPSAAELLPRAASAEGSVISRKSGEEISFIDIEGWRSVEVSQDLLAGDILRTNAVGSLALLFSDDTQMRMGRNTTLLVKKIGQGSDSELELKSGTVWARAKRGGSGLTVDTPSAAAAIRGTDWTLSIGENGATTLSVLEGSVELKNAQGSVVVNQGEGAFAAIGQAPRKYVLANLKEREQVLLYSELRGVFAGLPTSGMSGRQTRAERARVLAIPPARRSSEDWVSLAEASLSHDGRAAAREALVGLRRPLPAQLEARAKLVEAMIAGLEQRYGDANRLFAAALPALPRNRRASAIYGRWFAESLAEPDRDRPPPADNVYSDDPTTALMRAATVSHALGAAEAIEILKAAERRFPNDARLPAMRADLAFQLDRRNEVKDALARASAIDPNEPAYLLANARFRASISSDLDGALRDLKHAAKIAPGNDAIWNELGIVQSDRNAIVEADAAHRRAVELNPENAALHANYARFLMDNDQIAAAKAEIDRAEALDAQSYAVLAAKGRYLLRIGKTEEGEKTLLEASAVNPTYGDSLIGLAIGSYQLGAEEEAAQALDNADRFDPDNPSIPLIRSGIALDQYRAEDAIVEAREALRRRQARGGYYGGYDANRQVSSFLGIALDNVSLNEWSQYYADRSYDPFRSTTYLDEAASGRISPFEGFSPLLSPSQRTEAGSSSASSNLQALLLDPLAVASATTRNSLERTSFFETAIGGGLILQDGELGWKSDMLVQGTTFAPLPISYYLQAEALRPDSPRANDRDDITGANFSVGIHPTLEDNVYLFGDLVDLETGFPGQTWFPKPFDTRETRFSDLGIGWSHTFGDRNLLQAFAVVGDTHVDQSIDLVDTIGPYRVEQETEKETATIGVSHLYGIGPVTLRYGVETGRFHTRDSAIYTDLLTGGVFFVDRLSEKGNATRGYGDAMWEISEDLTFQGGVYLNWLDDVTDDCPCVDPRVGVAWSPVENHWLRAFYREDTQSSSNYTLAPVSTVGLTPLELPLFIGGSARTAALRWEAEWSERLFTSVEYQHQRFDGLSLDVPELLGSFDTTTGEIDRINISGNYWIGEGLGAFGSFTWNHSVDLTPGSGGEFGVPLVPDYRAQVGLTIVHPLRVKATIAQTFVGERVGAPFGIELSSYTTSDAAISWESPGGHLELGLQLLNVFDDDFDLAFGIPGPGRTVLGTVRAKF
ncbi:MULTISPECIES: FecR domain-containing protein [Sinorhizobium]|uniref:FecR domain-containing protein n=1 Tax=Sinorhizobium TaxID=28105 RepID=UPI000BE98E0A|nr:MULTISPECIES: FecR domain-containing protein [Sinorhizobium]PDT53385.1 UDP-N-acetylglucosamine-peptide N-acetylglucosaminyltransferase [Sinorhizobium sp. NG07B]POH29544.1 UDP-N-acetylglucosamine-peptide N-acetylglucosaminyltransferase [Sinorhizobium americanum]